MVTAPDASPHPGPVMSECTTTLSAGGIFRLATIAFHDDHAQM